MDKSAVREMDWVEMEIYSKQSRNIYGARENCGKFILWSYAVLID